MTKEEIRAKCEERYPVAAMQFWITLEQMYDTFCQKQLDYGPGAIQQDTDEMTLMGLWFRKNDKLNRLKTCVIEGNLYLAPEALQDTYLDLANYSIIAKLVSEGKWGK